MNIGKIIIAIDPDVYKSGVATITENGEIILQSLEFFQTIKLVYNTAVRASSLPAKERYLHIVVEAGWENRSNWHYSRADSPAVVAAKGRAQGRNEQLGKCILSFLNGAVRDFTKDVSITLEEKKPLRKFWKGRDRKITHEELKKIMGDKLTKKRTNQEERDAALLAWTAAGFPIHVN